MESGLVHLRAELHRKRSEAKKLSTNNAKPTAPLRKIVQENENCKKKLKSENNRDDEALHEEALKLEKSRKALEKKELLYNQIKHGTEVLEDDDLNQKYLIDFQEKINSEVLEAKKRRKEEPKKNIEDDPESYKAKNFTEEWVEYEDQFGRTRTCQAKDLKYFKEMDKSSHSNLHEKWDKVDQDTKSKSSVHYQDVLFDEARSHGASFMPFSRDEEERAAQQQFLHDLGTEAEKANLTKKALYNKRRKLMQERLTKVKQKKRLKMGLPVRDEQFKTPPTSDEEVEDQPTSDISSTTMEAPQNICVPLPIKTVDVREWDVGKPGVTMSQEQWIDSRREKRENEFAPPSAYKEVNQSVNRFPHNVKQFQETRYQSENHSSPSPRYQSENHSSPSPRYQSETHPSPSPRYQSETHSSASPRFERKEPPCNSQSEAKISEFAPPSSYDYYRPTTTKRSYSLGTKINLESAISKGISDLRKQFGDRK